MPGARRVGFEDFAEAKDELIGGAGLNVAGHLPDVLENLLPRVDEMIIGGGMACTFLKAQGHEVGKSLLEQESIPVATELMTAASFAVSAN